MLNCFSNSISAEKYFEIFLNFVATNVKPGGCGFFLAN